MIRNKKSMLEARIARLEKMLKNEGSYWKAVPDEEIHDYIKKSYIRRMEKYFDDNVIKYIERYGKSMGPKNVLLQLERSRSNLKDMMGTVMTNVIYGENIHGGPDDRLCIRLFNDIVKNTKPKTAFLRAIYDSYLKKLDDLIEKAKANVPAPYELASDIEDWFISNMAPTNYDEASDWLDDLRSMSKVRTNIDLIDECMDEIGAPEKDYTKVRKELAKLAKDAIDEYEENKRSGNDGNGAWRTDHF